MCPGSKPCARSASSMWRDVILQVRGQIIAVLANDEVVGAGRHVGDELPYTSPMSHARAMSAPGASLAGAH